MSKQKHKNAPDKKTQSVIDGYQSPELKDTDPMGSYTGQPTDSSEQPVQDVDDL